MKSVRIRLGTCGLVTAVPWTRRILPRKTARHHLPFRHRADGIGIVYTRHQFDAKAPRETKDYRKQESGNQGKVPRCRTYEAAQF